MFSNLKQKYIENDWKEMTNFNTEILNTCCFLMDQVE